MSMHCMKCDGRVFYDPTYSDNKFVEVYCIQCGVRRMIDKEKNVFGRWLAEKVRRVESALN